MLQLITGLIIKSCYHYLRTRKMEVLGVFDWVLDITDDNLFCSQNIAVIFLRSVDVKTTFRVDITNIIYAVVLSHTFVKVMQFLLGAFKTQQQSLWN